MFDCISSIIYTINTMYLNKILISVYHTQNSCDYSQYSALLLCIVVYCFYKRYMVALNNCVHLWYIFIKI